MLLLFQTWGSIIPWISQALSILKAYHTLSGIIILFVFGCLNPVSQFKWPPGELFLWPLQSVLDPSLHVFIAPWNFLHKTLQLDIWANICLIICFAKINCYLVYSLLTQNTLSYFVLYIKNILSLIFLLGEYYFKFLIWGLNFLFFKFSL